MFKQVIFKYPITTAEASCSPLFFPLILYASIMIFRPVSSHQPKADMSPSSSERCHFKGNFVHWIQRVPKCGRFWKELQNMVEI